WSTSLSPEASENGSVASQAGRRSSEAAAAGAERRTQAPSHPSTTPRGARAPPAKAPRDAPSSTAEECPASPFLGGAIRCRRIMLADLAQRGGVTVTRSSDVADSTRQPLEKRPEVVHPTATARIVSADVRRLQLRLVNNAIVVEISVRQGLKQHLG